MRLALLLLLALLSHGASAEEAEPAGEAASASISAAPPAASAQLSGREIYARVLENRFDSFVQRARLVSGDRAGRQQVSELDVWYQSFRDSGGAPRNGHVVSKSRVQYTAPFDIRHSGYLVIHNLDRPNDQFIYRSSQRKVRRVSLRGESVFGTDFSFEDIIPRELEDAGYERLADADHQGRPCFLVRATPVDVAESEYSRFDIKVDRERFIPLQTLYWDDREIAIKELTASVDAVERIEGIWIVRRSTMSNLRTESTTRLEIVSIEPNVRLNKSHFDLSRLTSSH